MLIPVEPPAPRKPAQSGTAWLNLGFRPFYLSAAAFAALAVPWWMLQRDGNLLPLALGGRLWHAHEMLFGFVVAVITGFLFTAGKVWTGLPTPQGRVLLGFVLLWLGARLLLPFWPGWLAAGVDLALLPLVAGVLGRLVWRSQTWRHLPIVGLLLGLAACNLIFHLARAGLLDSEPYTALHAALGLVVLIVATIAGRVIPGFTTNAVPQAPVRRRPRLDIAALAALALALLATVSAPNAGMTAALCLLAALLHLERLRLWMPFSTLGKPILWVLHLAYLWIPLGLLLLAAAALGYVPAAIAWHALGVGAMSGMISGMITRTALGHTGHPLRAGPGEIALYLLIQAAVLARVLPALFFPQHYEAALWLSAACWSLAFLIYFAGYFGRLTQPRADGRPG